MNNGSNFDISKLNNMLGLAKMLSNAPGNAPPQNNQEIPLDHLVSDQKMNMIKASLPYLEVGNQKNLAVLIKCMELKKTMALYEGNNINEVSEMNKPKVSKREMLANLRNYCSDRDKQMIDIVLNMQTLRNMMASFNNPTLSYNDPQAYQEGPPPPSNEDQNLNQEELIQKLKQLMQN